MALDNTLPAVRLIHPNRVILRPWEKPNGPQIAAGRLKESGGAQGMKLRTFAPISCLVGVIRDTWKDGTELAHPIRRKWRDDPPAMELLLARGPGVDLFHLSQNWRKALETGFVGSSTEIAEKVGLTSGRVRQIVRLSSP